MTNNFNAFIFSLFIFSFQVMASVSEKDLAICKADADCMAVPYSHCCGGPKKRAINKAHLDLYNSRPEWQKFNDANKCSTMGFCGNDFKVKGVVCVRRNAAEVTGECTLQH